MKFIVDQTYYFQFGSSKAAGSEHFGRKVIDWEYKIDYFHKMSMALSVHALAVLFNGKQTLKMF